MLKLSHVKKTFNKGTVTEKRALTGVDLTLNDGDFVTVIGGNGAGKSTLLNMIAGVYPLDSGVIELDGTDISRLSESQRAKYLGRVFQDPMRGTAADMQIAENLALAKRRGQRRGLSWGVTKAEKDEYVELLKRLDLGLDTRLNAKVGLLSGGQRQALTLLMATLTAVLTAVGAFGAFTGDAGLALAVLCVGMLLLCIGRYGIHASQSSAHDFYLVAERRSTNTFR